MARENVQLFRKSRHSDYGLRIFSNEFFQIFIELRCYFQIDFNIYHCKFVKFHKVLHNNFNLT